MCRLLGYVTSEAKTFPEVIGEGFGNFVELSREHKHGWGISTCSSEAQSAHKITDWTLAAESKKFEETSNELRSNGALLHLRLASKGLTVDLANNHPFTYGTYSFMHNGTITPMNSMDQFIDPVYVEHISSTTDSERYFFAMLSFIDQYGLVDGISKAVAAISQSSSFTSINCMLLTPEKLIAVCEFNEGDQSEWSAPNHYELRYLPTLEAVKVSSTGWGKDDWITLPNHKILVVDRLNLFHEVLDL